MIWVSTFRLATNQVRLSFINLAKETGMYARTVY